MSRNVDPMSDGVEFDDAPDHLERLLESIFFVIIIVALLWGGYRVHRIYKEVKQETGSVQMDVNQK